MIFALLNALQSGDPAGVFIVFTGYLIAIILGISLHEFAHALIAYRLGDLTPVQQGRLTINPLAHFDPFGTLLILFAGFGYGRPVMVNPYAFRVDRRTGMALVAIAGPITNILIAIAFGLSMRFLFRLYEANPSSLVESLLIMFSVIVSLNLGLAVFNMIPFPPLDGSKVLLALLPADMAYSVERFYVQTQQYGLIVLFLFLMVSGRFLGNILSVPVEAMYSLIVGTH